MATEINMNEEPTEVIDIGNEIEPIVVEVPEAFVTVETYFSPLTITN